MYLRASSPCVGESGTMGVQEVEGVGGSGVFECCVIRTGSSLVWCEV